MTECPSCKVWVQDDAKDCPSCGLNFAKWETKVAAAVIALERPPTPKRYSSPAVLAGLLLVSFVVGLWVFWPSPPSIKKALRTVEGQAPQEAAPGSPCFSGIAADEWDLSVPFPGQPMGLAWTGKEFLSCNRVDPWGLVRLDCDGTMKVLAVQEPRNHQKVQFNALVWNGQQAVGVVDGAWFQAQGLQFVLLDNGSLKLGKRFPAPPLIDSLAWDGTNYWTATRRNTQDANEEAFLYQLDAGFQVVKKWPAPAYGCQGLAWVGPLLVWVDVFEDQILLLKMEGDQPKVVHKFNAQEHYLSGVAWDGQALWLVDYDNHRLHRLPPRLTRAWMGGDFRVTHHEMLKVAQQVVEYSSGNPAVLDLLMAPMKNGRMDQPAMDAMTDGLVSLGLKDQGQQVLRDILARPESEPYRAMLQAELDRVPGLAPPVSGP